MNAEWLLDRAPVVFAMAAMFMVIAALRRYYKAMQTAASLEVDNLNLRAMNRELAQQLTSAQSDYTDFLFRMAEQRMERDSLKITRPTMLQPDVKHPVKLRRKLYKRSSRADHST